MQSFGTSKLVTGAALVAGAAALAALGAAPAVASGPSHGSGSGGSDVTAQASPYTGRVNSPAGLNVRSAAATDAPVLNTLGNGTTFQILCKVPAGSVDGNRLWYRMYNQDAWVSARYVTNVGAAPRACD